jgi:hypothetical protein
MAINNQLILEEALSNAGAELLFTLNNETPELEADMEADFWELNGTGLIVCNYDDGTYGMYQFVGKHGDPIEKDLAVIKRIAEGDSTLVEAGK